MSCFVKKVLIQCSASRGASICTVGEDNEWLWAERHLQTWFWAAASQILPIRKNDRGECCQALEKTLAMISVYLVSSHIWFFTHLIIDKRTHAWVIFCPKCFLEHFLNVLNWLLLLLCPLSSLMAGYITNLIGHFQKSFFCFDKIRCCLCFCIQPGYFFNISFQDSLPDLYSHFQYNDIETHMYASQWFLTLFTAKFPLSMVYCIMDLFLCHVSQLHIWVWYVRGEECWKG